ncbi:MAG: hypothetical protein IKP68_05690 [Clostridia bacterium]|nr:hypothetical protein [Clostridia bacterium]
MQKYTVEFVLETHYSLSVEANTPEEAAITAREELSLNDLTSRTSCSLTVKSIKELIDLRKKLLEQYEDELSYKKGLEEREKSEKQ